MSRVLVVEDNEDLAYGLRNNLEIEGHTVEVAADGQQGLELARSGRFELLILDLMLPEMDGFHVLRGVRESGLDTPVLILVLFLASFGFAIVGSVFAAMLLRSRSRDVLLPVVLYPILMPLLIAGVKALSGLFLNNLDWFWIKFLLFYDAAFCVVALWVFESLVIE